MGNMIQERLGMIIGSLVVAFILGAISFVVTQAVAQEKIDQLENRQTKHEQVAEKSLEKIDVSLEKIAKIIQEQAIANAESHHEHAR